MNIKQYQYQAFMSYAHDDERIATRLHRALETYRVPKALRKTHLEKISPIFRDVTELTAHHSLSEKIKDAVIGSRFLLVLCSPAAKASHWVNEEIKLFREVHGEGSILCALIEGTPRTSFPPALVAGGREPLAANLSAKNFNLGVSQLAASIIGVGLDRLIQRDVRRRRNRLRLMTAGAFAFSGVMAAMAWNAVDARTEAETSRTEAEKMVEYMVSDLKDDLDAIGKLDILEKAGKQVTAYYNRIPISDMDDDRLARRARSQQNLGHIALSQGNAQKALDDLLDVEKVSAEILRRNPNSPDAISTHAKSQYTLLRAYHQEDLNIALEYGLAYKSLSQKLYAIDEESLDYIFEYAWACNKLGQVYGGLKKFDEAEAQFMEAVSIHEGAKVKFPDNKEIDLQLITFRRNLAVIDYRRGDYEKAVLGLKKQIKSTKRLLVEDVENYDFLDSLYLTKVWLQYIAVMKLNNCDTNAIVTLAEELETRISYDTQDQRWILEYINLIYYSHQKCSAVLDKDWTTQTMTKVDKVYHLLVQKTAEISEKKTWLDNNQAKLFP